MMFILFIHPIPNCHRLAPSRRAFTVLELMIALALLGALLAVAWSILGSYRLAEQRGWDQAYRLQIVRTARELLENDVAHWDDVRSYDAFAENPEIDSLSAAFVGDENGFTIVMLPSLDPLPWLEEITASTNGTSTLGRADANGANGDRTRRIDGPVDRAQLKYEIVRDATGGGAMTLAHLRRQLTPLKRPSSSPNDDASAADRVLTSDDLYRRNESDSAESSRAMDMTLVRNLVAPRFRYGNGSEWFSQWDGREHGGLPRAIELSFDHPQANSPYRVTVDPESNAALNPTGEAEASVGADQAGIERDVRIVVHVPAGVALTTLRNAKAGRGMFLSTSQGIIRHNIHSTVRVQLEVETILPPSPPAPLPRTLTRLGSPAFGGEGSQKKEVRLGSIPMPRGRVM